jgi:hypothetical protein
MLRKGIREVQQIHYNNLLLTAENIFKKKSMEQYVKSE